MCFDSDNAGQNAAVRSLDHLLNSGLAVRVAVMPPPHDPDSYIKASGPEAFRAVIEQAEGFFDYYLKRLCSTNDLTTDKGRLSVLHDMNEAVQKTGNGVLIDTYARKTALRLGVSPESVSSEFSKQAHAKAPAHDFSESEEILATPAPPIAPPTTHEFWLLKLLLVHEELIAWAVTRVDPSWIQHPRVRDVVERLIASHTNHSWTSLVAFLSEFEETETRNLITEAAMENRTLPNPEQQIADVVLRLRNQYLDRQSSELLRLMNDPSLTDEQRLVYAHQRSTLRELRRSPLD